MSNRSVKPDPMTVALFPELLFDVKNCSPNTLERFKQAQKNVNALNDQLSEIQSENEALLKIIEEIKQVQKTEN